MMCFSFLLSNLVCFLFWGAPSPDPTPVEIFHKALTKAMGTPQDLSKIREDFDKGIGEWTSNPGSFVAFTKLHEALQKYLVSPLPQMDSRFPEMAADFKQRFEIFLKKLPLLGTLSDKDTYKDHLTAFYNEFLVGWIKNYWSHFSSKWEKTLTDLKPQDGLQELDFIHRATCSLLSWLPCYEGEADPKYQFYPLYAFKTPDGTVALIRIDPIWGGLSLHVKKKEEQFFCGVSVPGFSFDISEAFRFGGGGGVSPSTPLKSLLKSEGSHLIFSGWDFQVFRKVDYDVATNTFTLTSTPYDQVGDHPPAPMGPPSTHRVKGTYECRDVFRGH